MADQAPMSDEGSGGTADRILEPAHHAAAHTPAHAPSRPRGRGTRVAIVVLTIALVAALAGGTYLLVLARSWSDRAERLTEIVDQQTARITQTEEDLAVATAELEATKVQLATAQQRITELADEKAQVGDSQAETSQLLDYQQRVSTAAGEVASALTECINGQENLIAYLKDSARYDPTSLAQFQAQVDEFCGQATKANDLLQQELEK